MMISGEAQIDGGNQNNAFWKRLFVPGHFEWTFKMRSGEAESFFAPVRGMDLLAEREKRIADNPRRYLASTSVGDRLVKAVWELALGWGHVKDPIDGVRDLAALTRQWEPDLLILDQKTLSFAAGAVCFPSSWNLEKRVGQSIHEVHEVVPRLNPQIGEMITRFLSRLLPGKSSRRENWSITRTGDLDYHPDLNRKRLDDTVVLDELFLRVEHQLFTGISDGVLMGLRVQAVPLRELASEPAAWQAVAEKLRTMPEDVADYKAMNTAVPHILKEMDAYQAL
ncbi:MAG: heme-dependent oxidative N-demethylase subunit alpha family protein [Akkermansiaceae bacterium]